MSCMRATLVLLSVAQAKKAFADSKIICLVDSTSGKCYNYTPVQSYPMHGGCCIPCKTLGKAWAAWVVSTLILHGGNRIRPDRLLWPVFGYYYRQCCQHTTWYESGSNAVCWQLTYQKVASYKKGLFQAKVRRGMWCDWTGRSSNATQSRFGHSRCQLAT